jgi:PAS domain S-box-containing protein
MDSLKRKRALRITEERSKELLQRSGVALLVSRGVEQEVETINYMFSELFGYTMEDVPDVAHWWPLAYPDEVYREKVKSEWQTRVTKAIANQSEIEPMEAKVRCKDGSERYIEFHFSSLGDTHIVSFVDLTQRERAETALRESEKRFRLVADNAPVLIWMSGTNKLCTYFNKPWLAFTGRPMAQELGNGWAEGVHPDDLQCCVATYTQSFDRREEFRMEYRLRQHDGEYRWVFDIGVPRFNEDGSFAGYVGSVVDISHLKMAENSLRETSEQLRISDERLRLAQKVARIGTFEWNLKSGVNTWTGELEAMYGLPLGGFNRTQSAFERLIHPDDRLSVVRLVDSAFESGEPTEGEWRVVWPDGSVHWIGGRWQVFMDNSGEPARMIGVNIDVSQRKQTEAALFAANLKLLDIQEQERTRIARELHDDINQRLGLFVIKIDQLQTNPSDVQSRLQDLRHGICELSDDVQALSHQLHSSKLEYLGAVNGLKSWCREFGERQRIDIDFRSEVSSVLPREIGICLFRVLQEALQNAVKHSGAKQINVQLAEHSNEVHLIICDSGRGFDVNAARHGHGLGLTSMEERVRLVNGTVEIQSKLVQGTSVHVRVPLRSEYAPQRAAG